MEEFVGELGHMWQGIVPLLSQHDFFKGSPRDILTSLKKVIIIN